MDPFLKRCSHWYSIPREDQMSYEPHWHPLTEDSLNPLQSSPAAAAFHYSSHSSLNGSLFWGFLTFYGGGGYVFNLGDSHLEASSALDELETMQWVDHYTRAIFVEFSIWNANTNLFTMFILTLEFPPTGGAFVWSQIEAVNLYRYSGARGVLNLAAEIVVVAYMAVFTVFVIHDIVKQRKSWLSVWNILMAVSLALFYIALACYIMRSLWTMKTVENMMNNPGKEHLPAFTGWYGATHERLQLAVFQASQSIFCP